MLKLLPLKVLDIRLSVICVVILEQTCVTLDKSVWKEKRNRTVSLWINQSEKKPFQRIGKRDKPVWQEEQEEEPCQRVRKRDKPVVKKICYI